MEIKFCQTHKRTAVMERMVESGHYCDCDFCTVPQYENEEYCPKCEKIKEMKERQERRWLDASSNYVVAIKNAVHVDSNRKVKTLFRNGPYITRFLVESPKKKLRRKTFAKLDPKTGYLIRAKRREAQFIVV